MSHVWLDHDGILGSLEGWRNMVVLILDESMSQLNRHGAISIAFQVDSLLEVSAPGGGMGGITLREQVVNPPMSRITTRLKVKVRHAGLPDSTLRNGG